MFCFFQHDNSDNINTGERVSCWMVRWEKEKKREGKRKDAIGSFAGKKSSERPVKWNWKIERNH